MQNTGRRISSFFPVTGLVLGLNLVSGAWAENPTFSLLVAAKNGVAIDPPSATVEAKPGDVLDLEIYLRCWSNGDVVGPTGDVLGDPGDAAVLQGYQADLDFASFTSGDRGNVYPKNFEETTGAKGRCVGAMDGLQGSPNPIHAFVDEHRGDFVFAAPSRSVCAVNSVSCNYRYACTSFRGPSPDFLCPPPGLPFKGDYCGTVVLKVSADASGTFKVCFDERDVAPSPGTDFSFLAPYLPRPVMGSRISPLDFECAAIHVITEHRRPVATPTPSDSVPHGVKIRSESRPYQKQP